MSTTGGPRRSPAPRTLATLGVLAAATLALTACSSATGSETSSSTPTSSASADPSPLPVQATLGVEASTPKLAVTVSAVDQEAAPKSVQPSQSGTHWATAAVKECATADTRPARFTLTLADGTEAIETQSWPDGLPTPLIPSGEQMPAGQCIEGLVYFVVPDGASVVDVVMHGSSSSPQVTWPVLRAKATH